MPAPTRGPDLDDPAVAAQLLRFAGRAFYAIGSAKARQLAGLCMKCGRKSAGAPTYTCEGCLGDLAHGLVDRGIDALFRRRTR